MNDMTQDAVRSIAQLLAGCPIPANLDPTLAPTPYADLLHAVLASPSERLKAFDEALTKLPCGQATVIRRAIFAVEVLPTANKTKPSLTQDVYLPALPASALLEGDPLEMLRDHWIGQYCQFAQRAASMSPSSFHLANALAAGAAAVARRVCLRWSTLTIYPSLYILIVAPSTLYHKTTALNVLRFVLDKSDMGELLLPDMQTPESLMMEMGTTKPPTFETWSRTEQEQWQSSRRFAAQRLWVLDEAGRLLDSFKRDHTAGLLSLLLSLYDCPDHETMQTVGRGRQTILNGYLSFVGATTPDAIRSCLRHTKHWSDGFWARFALIGRPVDLPPFRFDANPVDAPDALVQMLRAVAFKHLPMPQVIKDSDGTRVDWPQPKLAELEPAARDAWQRYAKATGHDMLIGSHVDEMLFAPYGRLATLALKVALVIATLARADSSTIRVTYPDWHAAQLIVEGWRAELHRIISETQETSEAHFEDRVLSLLRTQHTATRRELMRLLHCKRDDLVKLLTGMTADGLIVEQHQINKRGPATFTYAMPEA